LAKFFLDYFYTHLAFLSTPLFTFVNELFTIVNSGNSMACGVA
jgi:hypothetical protein